MADPVTIYLVRHAIAAERGPDYPDDSRRPLTAKGIERFRECVTGLAATGVVIDEIFTSPYVRARQTADLLAEGLDPSPRLVSMHALSADGAPLEVLAALARAAKHPRVALVGHAPSIGLVAARLVGARRGLDFKKGAIACVEAEGWPVTRPGRLLWFLPPRLLRLMARR